MDCLISNIISIIAVIVAIALGLPKIYERPNQKVFFDCSKGYKLWCWIRNIPVTNKLLIWLGTKRRPQEFDITITITNEDGDIISRLTYPRTSSNDIRIGIVEVKSKYDNLVFLKDESDKFSHKILKAGLHKVFVELYGDGRELKKKSKQFRVNEKYPFVEWLKR